MGDSAFNPVMDPAQAYEQRRFSTRQALAADATVVAETGDGRLFIVHVFDISMGGIGFHGRRAVEPGLTCRIRLQTSRLQLDTRIEITRCHERPEGYDIGAKFIEDSH